MEKIEEKQPPDVITSDTENATRVEPRDAPPHKRQRFEEFRAYNTGAWNGPRRENKELIRQQDNLHLYDAVTSKIELTDYQRQRGRRLLKSHDLSEMTAPDRPLEHVVFGLCVLLVNDDGTRYYPGQIADEAFETIADDFELDTSDQISLIERLRPRVEL